MEKRIGIHKGGRLGLGMELGMEWNGMGWNLWLAGL